MTAFLRLLSNNTVVQKLPCPMTNILCPMSNAKCPNVQMSTSSVCYHDYISLLISGSPSSPSPNEHSSRTVACQSVRKRIGKREKNANGSRTNFPTHASFNHSQYCRCPFKRGWSRFRKWANHHSGKFWAIFGYLCEPDFDEIKF